MFSGGDNGAEIENLILNASEMAKTDPNHDSYYFFHENLQQVDLWVFNATLKNAEKGFYVLNSIYYLSNVLAQEATLEMYNNVLNGSVNWYELLDVLVKDSNNVAVSNATLIITPNATAPVSNVVTKWFYNQTNIVTGIDGHTPLPDNENGTVAILRERVYSGGRKSSYSYTLSAYDSSRLYESVSTTIFSNGTMQQLEPVAMVTNITPNSSWYRPNPNTYQNTTTLTINLPRSNISINFSNGSITVNATRTRLTAISDYVQSYVVLNNTIPEFANKNVSFFVDGALYSKSTANSTGFVSFNYIGAWSSHTFEWSEGGNGNASGYITDQRDENPLAGSTVILYYLDGTSYGLSNITLNDGSYLLRNITNGTSVYIRASKTGYASANSSVFTVPTNGTFIMNLSLWGIGNITGYIISGSSALSSAEVKLYYGNSTEYGSSTTSAADGSYNITSILNNTWLYVRASKSGYTSANSSNFTVPTSGTVTQNVTLSAETTSSSSSGGSGGGGGGGGGGSTSGENYTNIELREKYDLLIYKDVTTSYWFRKAGNPIVYINITGNTNGGEITTDVEVLWNTSSLVKNPTEGTVYKNVNIWVGTYGFATPNNIKHAEITFKVPRSWIQANNIDPNSVSMMRYDGYWQSLPTQKINENAEELYYKAITNSFSPFAITGRKADAKGSSSINSTYIGIASQEAEIKKEDGDKAASVENKSNLSNYFIVGAILGILLNACLVLKIRKRER